MEFFNREKELRQFEIIARSEPAFIYFVFGPINSGKTELIEEFIKRLDEKEYRIIYINLRGRMLSQYEDFIRTLFRVRREGIGEKLKQGFLILKKGVELLGNYKGKVMRGIELPYEVLKILWEHGRVEDVYAYLEEIFRHLRDKGLKPIFIIDELQMLRGLKSNGELLASLFNFFVRLTKETHLSHVFAVTSDSLFVEYVYNNAKLQGRCEYLMVDNLDKEYSFEFYKKLNFEEKDFQFIWENVGGNINYVLLLKDKINRGIKLDDAAYEIIRDAENKLNSIIGKLERRKKKIKIDDEEFLIGDKDVLKALKEIDSAKKIVIKKEPSPEIVFLIRENILFLNPVTNEVSAQNQVYARAIERVVRSSQ